MKITEIVLVTENRKGTEKNCLMTVEDYLEYLDLDRFDSRKDVADAMLELGRTLGNENDWSEYYFASNKSVYARFCMDEMQLERFLEGFYNSTDQEVSFDKGMCSEKCLEKLSELCMDTRGNVNIFALTYTEAYCDFEQGTILHNFNGNDYRVMEKLSAKNLLLQDERSGNFVVALGVSLFARHPKGTEAKEGNCQIGIEWGHGVYLVLPAFIWRIPLWWEMSASFRERGRNLWQCLPTWQSRTERTENRSIRMYAFLLQRNFVRNCIVPF